MFKKAPTLLMAMTVAQLHSDWECIMNFGSISCFPSTNNIFKPVLSKKADNEFWKVSCSWFFTITIIEENAIMYFYDNL